jgi:hypothetical protein
MPLSGAYAGAGSSSAHAATRPLSMRCLPATLSPSPQVAGWLGVADVESVLEKEGLDVENEAGRQQGLGLGAKYLPHNKVRGCGGAAEHQGSDAGSGEPGGWGPAMAAGGRGGAAQLMMAGATAAAISSAPLCRAHCPA